MKVVVQMGVAQNHFIIVVTTGFAHQLRVIVHRLMIYHKFVFDYIGENND